MPLTPLEALNKVVDDRVAQTRLTSVPFLASLYENNRIKSKTNTQIDWDVEVGGGGAAIESINADGADTATDNTVPANLRIGRYRVKHQFSVNRVDLAEAATRAPQDLADLFNTHVDRGLNHIFRTINGLLYNGDGTAASGEVVGILKVLDDAYNYGGINVTANPIWKALRLHNAGTNRNLTKNLLLAFDEAVKVNETLYNMIICHPSMGTKYNQLFDSIGGGLVVVNNNADAPKRVELGAGVRTYNGTPILEDPMAPTGQMLFMYAPDFDLYTFDMASNPQPMSQSEWKVASSVAYGMHVNIAELPSNNSAKRKFELYVLPQLRVFNRKSLQALQDLS